MVMPSGRSKGGSTTGKTSGTSRLYRLTGTRAAVATPKQLHRKSMAAAARGDAGGCRRGWRAGGGGGKVVLRLDGG